MTYFTIGLDGSVGAAAALRWAARLAVATGAELHAVNAYQRRYAELPPDDFERALSDREELLAEWAGSATDLGVIGTRGTGGFTGLRIGGVAMKVLHRTTSDLVMVPPTAGE